MQLFSLLSTLFLAGSAFAIDARYSDDYNSPDGSMNGVACSNGEYGLASQYPTFGDLPSFPNIGGAPFVSFNSPQCGSCWQLTYRGTSIFVTVIDRTASGFVLSREALDTLTDGRAYDLGVVHVDAIQVDESYCGL